MKNYGFNFNDPNLKRALKQAKELNENIPAYKVQQNMSKMLKDLNIDNRQLDQMQKVANSFNQYRINNPSIDNLLNNSSVIKKRLDSIKSMDPQILKSVNELQSLIGKPGEPLTNEQSSNVRKVYDTFSDLDNNPFDADSFEGNKESNNPRADHDNVVSNTDNGLSSSGVNEDSAEKNEVSKEKDLEGNTDSNSSSEFPEDKYQNWQYYQNLLYIWIADIPNHPFKAVTDVYTATEVLKAVIQGIDALIKIING